MRKRPRFPTGMSRAYFLDDDHAHIGQGLVYCRNVGDSAPPRVTHSRVRCGLCGQILQSAVNPLGKRNPAPTYEGLVANFIRKGHPAPLARELAEREMAQVRIFMTEAKRGQGKKFSKNPTAARLREAAGALVKSRVLTPDTARRVVGEALTYGLDRLPERTQVLVKSALSYLPRENPNKKGKWRFWHLYLGKRYAEQVASDIEKTYGYKTRVTDDGYPFWRVEVFHTKSWWKRHKINPPSKSSPVKIYGRTEKIFMKKTSGPYKGQRFVHDFKGGVEQHGFPRGTVVQCPNGKSFKLTTRSVILTGKKDLWRNFPA